MESVRSLVRIRAHETRSMVLGRAGWGLTYPPGEYTLQVIFETVDTVVTGPGVLLRTRAE